MRVFLVKTASANGQPPPVEELDAITVAADGDQAKRAGRAALTDMGYSVRSINWSPNAKGGNDLLAYVSKEG